jgi:hypothetical protein
MLPEAEMRDLQFYLKRVRAFPGRPIVVWGYPEVDDRSYWWDLFVVFAPADGAKPWTKPWFDYDDPVTGRHPVSTDEVEGQRFAELLIAVPPGDVFDGGGCYQMDYPAGYERDFEGRDQQATKDLGARLAAALEVGFAFEPPDAPPRRWWELPEGEIALARFLR